LVKADYNKLKIELWKSSSFEFWIRKQLKNCRLWQTKKLIEINEAPVTAPVDWASFIGSLPKMSLSEIEKEVKSFRD
jgi:hypothetical protein